MSQKMNIGSDGKVATLDASGLTANRTITVPDAAVTIVGDSNAQTISGVKTFSAAPSTDGLNGVTAGGTLSITGAAATGATVGEKLSLGAGAGNGTGKGGETDLYGGFSAATTGGLVYITGGGTGGTSTKGGDVNIQGGDGTSGINASGGLVYIYGGAPVGSGTAGDVILGNPGRVAVQANGSSFNAYLVPSITANRTYTLPDVTDTIVARTTTDTLTNKRVTKRTNTVASSATPAINTDTTDEFDITALAVAITSMSSGLTGTPNNGDELMIRFKDNGTGRAITWGTSFVSSGVATLLATTVASKTHYVKLRYDSTAAKWVCMAVDATGY